MAALKTNYNQQKYVLFEGYLAKQSLHLKQLRKRWIVLERNGKLCCYKTKEMKDPPTEIINTRLFTSIEFDNTSNQNQFTLKYHHQKRVFKSTDHSVIKQLVKLISEYIGKSIKDDEHKKKWFDEQVIREAAKENGILTSYGDFVHKVDKLEINCPELLKSNTIDPLKCPIYRDMKNQNKYTQQNLAHLHVYKTNLFVNIMMNVNHTFVVNQVRMKMEYQTNVI